ncbi:MAG: hypothetical protein JSR44_16300 [Spirochaetes bacterium]|nr:hypothetical protein [Spirochaetota bacterium]
MKALCCFALICICATRLMASDELPLSTQTTEIDDGFLSLETGFGYDTYPTSQFAKVPLFFTGGSSNREITSRFVVLSDIAHASSYFAGDNSFLNPGGIYLYNFGLMDIDYLSWHGRSWSFGFGGGAAHQGFLIAGADKAAHAIVLRVRSQAFVYWSPYLATQAVVTLPLAIYQSATDEFRLWQTEFNILFDFKGRVRNPLPQSIMFSASLHYDYIHLNTSLRTYSQNEFIPMFKVMIVY